MGKAIQVKNFCDILKSRDQKRIISELPRIESFRQELKESLTKSNAYSGVESELCLSLSTAVKNSYGVNWDLYMSLILLPSNDKQGIVYVKTNHTFKESIEWIITTNGKITDNFVLKGPAETYEIWRDVEEKKPIATFNSLKEILTYQKFKGLQFLVMPNVEIKGIRDYLSLQNWFGDNSSFWTGQDIRNPYWDT